MPYNLLELRNDIYESNTEVALERNSDDVCTLYISFYTNSKSFTGSGNDDTETLIENGRVLASGPIVVTDLTDGSRTGFGIALRINSKKPSTGGLYPISGAFKNKAIFELLLKASESNDL